MGLIRSLIAMGKEREARNLLTKMFTGGALTPEEQAKIVMYNPNVLTGANKLQSTQREQAAADAFTQAISPKTDWANWMPEGSVLTPEQMQGLLTGKTPTEAGIAPPATVYPSGQEIQNAILARLGATGNFSELSGLLPMSKAFTEDETRQREREKWDLIKGEIGNIRRGNEIPATSGMTTPNPLNVNGIDIQGMLTGVPSMPITIPGQPARREGLTPQQSLESQSILNALGVNTGNITGGQLDLARIDEINQKIARGEALLPYEIEELKQKAIKLDKEASAAEQAGNYDYARTLRQQIENEYLPMIFQTKIGKTTAEKELIQTQAGKIKEGKDKDMFIKPVTATGKDERKAQIDERKAITAFIYGAPLETELSDDRKRFLGFGGRIGRNALETLQPLQTRTEYEEFLSSKGIDPYHTEYIVRALDKRFGKSGTQNTPSGQVMVESPDGKKYYLPAGELQEAIRQGYRRVQ